ncbi:hypothetical protein B9G55_02925 [Saccharibacillus sp. O16]|nr:hypothetical protein B9G55_02925 [Saccharibacillus sp. O16]
MNNICIIQEGIGMTKRLTLWMVLAACSLWIAGCGSAGNPKESAEPSSQAHTVDSEHSGHSEHGASGMMPKDLKEAVNPAYPVGTSVTLHTDHMPGMNGASGTVTGAYDTIIYSVSYMPTNGGDPVDHHKWVIREELKSKDGSAPEVGDSALIEADHMEGMKGAEAKIDTAKQGVIYMVDYMPTEGGEMVQNHMWLTEEELSAK